MKLIPNPYEGAPMHHYKIYQEAQTATLKAMVEQLFWFDNDIKTAGLRLTGNKLYTELKQYIPGRK